MKLPLGSLRRIISATTFIIALIPACLKAADADRIDLDQALAIALERNPSLAASRSDVDAAQAGVTQATAAYYPQLKASAGYDRTWSDQEAGASDGGDSPTEITDTFATGISLSQYLFDFGKTQAEVDRSRKSLAVVEKQLTTVEKTLVRDVAQAYFEVLKNHELVTVSQENLAMRRQLLDQAKALYEQGMRPRIDVTSAEAELSQAQLSLVTSQFGVQEATIAFERLLGGPPSSGAYTLAEVAPAPSPTTDLPPLIQKGTVARSEIAALQAQVDAAQAGVLATRRSAYPSLDATGSYAYEGEAVPMEDHRWQVGVSLNWSLFTGFRQAGEVAEAKADLKRLRAELRNQKLQVTEEISQAFFQWQTAKASIRSAETALRQAEENLAIARGRYKAGVSDVVELSDAQVLYTESRSALVQAVYERHEALAGLTFAVGTALPHG
jgi:outer membrane protein